MDFDEKHSCECISFVFMALNDGLLAVESYKKIKYIIFWRFDAFLGFRLNRTYFQKSVYYECGYFDPLNKMSKSQPFNLSVGLYGKKLYFKPINR